MSEKIKLDARQVLAYLNEMGYCNITTSQLKEFMKDLKTLLKYHDQFVRQKTYATQFDQMENMDPLAKAFSKLHTAANTFCSKAKSTKPPGVVTVEMTPAKKNPPTPTSNRKKSPADSKIVGRRLEGGTSKLAQKVEEKLSKMEEKAKQLLPLVLECPKNRPKMAQHINPTTKTVRGIPAGIANPSERRRGQSPTIVTVQSPKIAPPLGTTRLDGGSSRPVTKPHPPKVVYNKTEPKFAFPKKKPTYGSVISETTYRPRDNVQITNIVCDDHNAVVHPLPVENPLRNYDFKILKPTPQPKAFIRPKSSASSIRLRSDLSDPVILYQRYKNEWSKRKLPGEDARADLRWKIRHRMMGDPKRV